MGETCTTRLYSQNEEKGKKDTECAIDEAEREKVRMWNRARSTSCLSATGFLSNIRAQEEEKREKERGKRWKRVFFFFAFREQGELKGSVGKLVIIFPSQD